MPDRIAPLPEPCESGVFDGGFVEGHRLCQLGKVFVVALVEGRPRAFQNIYDSPVDYWVFN